MKRPPPEIGPHEGRELSLMLAGEKPLARFSEAVAARHLLPEALFAPHVASGHIVKREYPHTDTATGISAISIYYALPTEEWRIAALLEIDTVIISGKRMATDADDREIGRLLGYTEVEIAAFLSWKRQQLPSQGMA